MKKPTFEDVVAFVETAMKKELPIITDDGLCNWDKLVIVNSESSIKIILNEDVLKIVFEHLNPIVIELTEFEKASFKVFIYKVKEYSENKAIKRFNNYFTEEENKVSDINDLDNEDD